MSIKLDLPKVTDLRPRLTVIGIGGAGCNAVNNMIAAGLSGVEFVVANTDAQALAASSAEHRLQLGVNLTEGLGAGARPEIGEAAAEEALDDIRAQISGSHMVFLAAGMGGGTGTGAASVIARISRELGILTVGVVTKPFLFEGSRRMRVAEAGIEQLRECVDTLIVIPNQNLFRIANEKTTFSEAFLLADQVLYSGVACIIDLILKEGLINLDFADVRAILSGMGTAMMGTGEAEGERRAILAAEEAIANPLLDDVTLRGAQGLLLSITGGPELTLYEVDEAASRVRQEVDPEANIIVGATFDDTLGDSVRVSIVASGMERQHQSGSSSGKSTGGGFGPGSMTPNHGGAGSGGMASMAGPASNAVPPQAPFPAPADQQGAGGFIPNLQPDAPAHGSLLAGAEGKPHTGAADHGAMAPPPVPGQDETDLQRKLADAMQYRDGHPPQDGRGIGDGVLPTYDEPAGEQNAQYETWQAPGDVLIESERPQLTPPPAPMPAAAEQASNDDPYAGVSGDFQPMPPSDIRRPGRRMPDVGDFPQVGQREYHAKKSDEEGGDGYQGQQRSRKPSFFERLTGFARTQGDSEGHERESDERSMSTQSRRENRGGVRGGEGPDSGSSDERADTPQAPELPVFFNRGQR